MGDNTHDTPDQIKPETIVANKAGEASKTSTPADQAPAAATPTTDKSDRSPHEVVRRGLDERAKD